MYYDDYRDISEFDELDDTDNMEESDEFEPPFFCPIYQQMFYGYRQFPTPPPFPPGTGGPMNMPPFGNQPGGPPFENQPAGPPFGNQPGGPQHGNVPMGPPPNFTPSKAQSEFKPQAGIAPQAIDSGAIRRCRFRYVYIWPRYGRGFWAWLTYVGRRSIAGYRWNGRRWVYFGMDLRMIESFYCY